jgi:hypothetical protein
LPALPDRTIPLYLELAEITGSTPCLNFNKYLNNREGSEVIAFGSQAGRQGAAGQD